MATSSACERGHLRTFIGASVMFRMTLRCGNRLNDWNTMPTSCRMASMFRTSFDSSTPSTMMSPRWCSSSRLIVRMNVDLPEPEGPRMTTFSSRRTVVETPLSTWNAPNHLCTSRATMMSSGPIPWPLLTIGSSPRASCCPMRALSSQSGACDYLRPTPMSFSTCLLT